MKFSIKHLSLLFLSLIIISIIIDLVRISNYRTIPSLPAYEFLPEVSKIYFELVNDTDKINWEGLNGSCEYIDKQYDVSDFRIATLIRIIYDFRRKIPDSAMLKIKKTLLNFRYWMDEPGQNSMCYWSENHQILFASAEYLAGQLYPDSIFANSGLSGKEHMAKAAQRIKDWLEMRWKFGFSEFYSNTYYNEDIAGMINLIDYAHNDEIVKKTEIIMDLLMYDIASQKSGNMFVSVSGRAYERGRKGGTKLSLTKITNFLWNKTQSTKQNISINYGFLTSKKYRIPQVLLEIGKDTSNVVIKQCNGLNISQLKAEEYYGTDNRSIMMQWGMEAFSDPEIVRNSLTYIRKDNMFSNEFLAGFKYLDFTLLRIFQLEPFLVQSLNPQSNGTAIQQANTYTYKTKNYSLYSVQNYFPGNFANQIHVAGMNIKNFFSIFHNHPALPKGNFHDSPNYWVGYGRLPHVVQDSSISLSIYDLPVKKGIMEMAMLDFTHAYFPKEKFDSVKIAGKYAFGKKGKTYCALIGKNNFYYVNNSSDDLIQQGRRVFWIIESGAEDQDVSFNNFCNRITGNKVIFDENNLILTYNSKGKELKLKYCGNFCINGSSVKTEYERYDSPYIKAKFKPDSLDFRYNKKFLHLEFSTMKREYN
jgi:hypothetical protein